MTASRQPDRLLVLGLGNVLCSDDGLGVAAVERIRREYRIPDDVVLLDGGTLGLALLSHIDGFNDVIIVDAIRAERPPGSLVRLEGEEVAPAVRERLSVHQVGVADLLDALRLLDAYPRRLVLWGLVPETIQLGLERSPAVAGRLSLLIQAVVDEVGDLGYEMSRYDRDETTLAPQRGAPARALGL